jgi:gluconate 2-dehydrogenase gamma chain
VTLNSKLLTRRKAIQGAVAFVGGTVAATQLGSLVDSVSAMDDGLSPQFLSLETFSMVEKIVDLVIPETDTPGAKAVGVHRFIDLMLAEWASPETQVSYVNGLRGIDMRVPGGFSALPPMQQMELLEALDAEAYADGAGDTFFKDLKTFILFGYYSSEVGASVELKFDRLPGAYRGCVPFEDIGRTWST